MIVLLAAACSAEEHRIKITMAYEVVVFSFIFFSIRFVLDLPLVFKYAMYAYR